MTKSTGVGTGNYVRDWKRIVSPIKYLPDNGVHYCETLSKENAIRVVEGESKIYIFQDEQNASWNMRVGIEFVRMNRCPFCGETL